MRLRPIRRAALESGAGRRGWLGGTQHRESETREPWGGGHGAIVMAALLCPVCRAPKTETVQTLTSAVRRGEGGAVTGAVIQGHRQGGRTGDMQLELDGEGEEAWDRGQGRGRARRKGGSRGGERALPGGGVRVLRGKGQRHGVGAEAET